MSFIGWIELIDNAYIIYQRETGFEVNEYRNGCKIMDSQQLLSLKEFKQFVDGLDIDQALLPQNLQDVLHSNLDRGNA